MFILVETEMDNYLHGNPQKVEEYVIQNVSQDQLERWLIRKTKSEKKIQRSSSGEGIIIPSI